MGGPPAWGLGQVLTNSHHKNLHYPIHISQGVGHGRSYDLASASVIRYTMPYPAENISVVVFELKVHK